MLHGAALPIEVRADAGGAVRLTGAFPYGVDAQLGDGRRERFAPGAFRARVAAGAKVYLLAGHDPEQPLAATNAGLTLRDADDALHIEARVAGDTSWARDTLAALAAGLKTGVSPGFRVAKDEVTRDGAGLLRTVHRADLFELSIVTAPAYSEAQILQRSWTLTPEPPDDTALKRALNRWRP